MKTVNLLDIAEEYEENMEIKERHPIEDSLKLIEKNIENNDEDHIYEIESFYKGNYTVTEKDKYGNEKIVDKAYVIVNATECAFYLRDQEIRAFNDYIQLGENKFTGKFKLEKAEYTDKKGEVHPYAVFKIVREK